MSERGYEIGHEDLRRLAAARTLASLRELGATEGEVARAVSIRMEIDKLALEILERQVRDGIAGPDLPHGDAIMHLIDAMDERDHVEIDSEPEAGEDAEGWTLRERLYRLEDAAARLPACYVNKLPNVRA